MDAATLIRDLDPIWQARLVWNRAAETILIATAIAVAMMLSLPVQEAVAAAGDAENGEAIAKH